MTIEYLLEPALQSVSCKETVMVLEGCALSQAVSLRRIADALETQNALGEAVRESLNVIALNLQGIMQTLQK